MAILFQEKVNQAFIIKAQQVAKRLGIPVDWLMAVIELETGGEFRADIVNSLGYTGLIQFGKAAAERIGTTQEKLKEMTEVEQLEYVYKYLYIYRHKLSSYVDLYLSIFFPAALDKPLDYVLQTKRLSASRIAKANPLFDINKDGKITVAEIQQKLLKRIPNDFHASILSGEKVKKKAKCPTCGQSL